MVELIDGGNFLDSVLSPAPLTMVNPRTIAGVEFTVKRFILQGMLEKAITVVPTRDVMPVLKDVQVEVTDAALNIVASDMELSLICTTPLVDVAWPGIVVLPARKFLEIVKFADEGDCHVKVIGRQATVRIKRTSWNLTLAGGSDFPAMPKINEIVMTSVDRHAFTRALTAVRYAACRDAARSSLMMVQIIDGKFVACDGSRLQRADLNDFHGSFHIPINAVDDLLKLMKSLQQPEISIGQTDHHLVFELDTDVFIVSKLQAHFPDMEAQLLRPALGNDQVLTVDRGELLRVVRRVRINADPETSAIALTLQTGGVQVAARDKYANDASELVEATWSGGERTIMVNHGYLTEMIAGSTSDTLMFYLGPDTKTRKSPLVLKDEVSNTVGVVQQMLSDWVGR
jgi:DNA polymerase III subunit beta